MKQEIILSDGQIRKPEIVADRNHIESFVKRQQTIMDKLKILTDAAKYDVGVIALGLIKKN